MQQATMPVGKWISVSAPGGMARQVFVDAFDKSQSMWIRVGTFSDEGSALQRQASLKQQGLRSRLVRHCFCPTAR